MAERTSIRLNLPDDGSSVELDQLVRDAKLGDPRLELEKEVFDGGLKLAKWLLLTIGCVLLLVAAYAVATYPEPQDLDQILGAAPGSSFTADDRIAAWQQLRSDWFSSIKDLLQLLVVSLLVPLLATLIGHVFARTPGRDKSDPS